MHLTEQEHWMDGRKARKKKLQVFSFISQKSSLNQIKENK
jgi:hypothetical protein